MLAGLTCDAGGACGATPARLATPAVGIVLWTRLLGEKVTPDLLAGSTLILAGVAFAARPARRVVPRLEQSR
jgi:drug/metabolite transporter (DMT)-like permease